MPTSNISPNKGDRNNKLKVIILGAGVHAKVVYDIFCRMNCPVSGFIDDNIKLAGSYLFDLPILGTRNFLDTVNYNDCELFIGIGDADIRMGLFNELQPKKFRFPNAIHPFSAICENVKMGVGNAIMAGTIINPYVIICNCVILNTSCSIDHDCIIEDGVHIAPGAHIGGEVRIGKKSFIGLGASIIQGITIGANTVIGAGATVINDIPENVLAVGVPAKIKKKTFMYGYP